MDWTETDLIGAINLHDQGLSWAAIAERYGRSRGALESQVCRYRKGILKFSRIGHRDESARMLAMAEEGRTFAQICAAFPHKTKFAVSMRLLYHGFDRETRRLYREKPGG